MTYTKSDEQNSNSSQSHDSEERGRGRDSSRRSGRKERVLHTRVSEQLSEEIRAFAEDLRVPASNLVRNVLEEVFTVVDGVTDDVGGLFDDLLKEAEGVRDRMRSDPRGRRGSRGTRRRRGRGQHEDLDVEDELRRDEAWEARASSGSRARADDAGSAKGPGDGRTDGDGPARSERNAAEAKASQPKSAAELFPNVLGWQPLVLNRAFDCGRCKRDLRPGESAFLGLGAEGLTEIALCGRCAGNR